MNAGRDRIGLAFCLVAAAGYALLPLIAKQAYAADVDIVPLLGWRFAIATVALWAIVACRRPARPSRRTVLAGLGLGAIGFGAQASLYFAALRHLDASLAALLLYTYPAMVCGASVALGREPLTRRSTAALALATGGAALVLLGGGIGTLSGIGVALAVLTAMVYACYILVSAAAVEGSDPFVLSAFIATGAAATFLGAGVVTGGPSVALGTDGWALVVAIAFACTVIPIAALLLGMRRIGAPTAAIASTSEPVITVVLAMLFFGESLGAVQLAGGALVVAAVIALQLPRRIGADGTAARTAAAAAARAPAQGPA